MLCDAGVGGEIFALGNGREFFRPVVRDLFGIEEGRGVKRAAAVGEKMEGSVSDDELCVGEV